MSSSVEIKPVHFIWFGPQEFMYPEYLAVRTAYEVYHVQPNIWVEDTDSSLWLDRAIQYASVMPIRDEWLKVCNSIEAPVHKCDYLRCEVLCAFGGLYLDIDTLCVKSICDLDLHGLVVARQNAKGREALNGAVMYVAEPQHPAVVALLEAVIQRLKEAGEMSWSELGPPVVTRVVKGRKDCTILSRDPFYLYKHGGRWHWRYIFKDVPLDNRIYVLHWYASMAGEFVKETVTPEYIRSSDSLYAKVVREVLGDDSL